MKIGIFAKTFSAVGAKATLAAVSEAGFDCAQFNLASLGMPPMPDIISPITTAEIAVASAESRVPIVAVSGTYNMIHPDETVREQGLRRLRALIAASPAMGTRLVTLCTGTRDATDQWQAHPANSDREAWRDLTVEIAWALATAEAHDVDLGIEPELGNVVSSARLARRLIDEMRSRHLKIVLDPANLFERAKASEARRIIEEAVDLLADRIVIAHAKDRKADGSFCTAGKGVINFRHFATWLKRAGVDVPLVAHGLAEREANTVARYLRDVVADATGAAT
jgi:sugar phosphate isomerase/epimerase